MKSTTRMIFIALLLILVSCVGASMLQSDGRKVDITNALIPMANGEQLSVLVYKPHTATKDTPAPCVVTAHGYFNSKEMQDITYVELARRGFVVFSMDIYHHGLSSGTRETYLYNREFYALGMLDLVDYIHDKINYVDKTRIGITGHSTGGRMVSYALDAYGRNYKIANGITDGSHYSNEPADAGKYQTKIASALIVANFPAYYLLENIPPDLNVGITMGYYDEGAPMQLTKIDGYFWSDLSISPESKNFINLMHPGTFKLDKSISYDTPTGKPAIKLSGWDLSEKVEMGKAYGSVAEKNLRIVYNPREFHPWNHFSAESSAIMTDFFTMTLGAPNQIPGGNQRWFAKELFNCIGLVGFFLFILPFAYSLLDTGFFSSLKAPALPAKQPAPKSKGLFYFNLLLGTVIPAVTVMPFMLLNVKLFPYPATQNTTAWFSQPSTNQIMIWAVLNGLIALALFLINYYAFGKKTGVEAGRWGLGISLGNLVKTVAAVFIILLAAYNLVILANIFFVTDFRIWTFAVKIFSSTSFVTMLKYLPFFFIFYAVNALVINGGNRVEGQKDCLNMTLCAATNVVGLIFVILLQYAVLFARGEAVWHPNLSWICILLLIPFVPILILAAIYSRKLYEKTGSIWMGALLNTVLFTLITTSNTTTIMKII